MAAYENMLAEAKKERDEGGTDNPGARTNKEHMIGVVEELQAFGSNGNTEKYLLGMALVDYFPLHNKVELDSLSHEWGSWCLVCKFGKGAPENGSVPTCILARLSFAVA